MEAGTLGYQRQTDIRCWPQAEIDKGRGVGGRLDIALWSKPDIPQSPATGLCRLPSIGCFVWISATKQSENPAMIPEN